MGVEEAIFVQGMDVYANAWLAWKKRVNDLAIHS